MILQLLLWAMTARADTPVPAAGVQPGAAPAAAQQLPEPPAPCNGMGPGVTIRVACTGYCAPTQMAAINKVAEQMKIRVQFLVLMDDSGRAKVDLADPDKSFDALISPGGWDTLPSYFGAIGPDNAEKKELRGHMQDLFCNQKLGKTGEFTQKRDNFEFNFDADTYLKNSRYRNVPFVAVCYGMQLMGAALGLPEYVDLAADLKIPNRSKVSDPVTILDRNSKLGKIFPQGSFTAYENHHQGLHLDYYRRHPKDFPALKVTAVSNGGQVMESFEVQNRNFLGVQFHPEDSADEVKLPIYRWLLTNACQHVKQTGKRFSIANWRAKLQKVPGVPAGASDRSSFPALMGCPTPNPNPPAAPAPSASMITGP